MKKDEEGNKSPRSRRRRPMINGMLALFIVVFLISSLHVPLGTLSSLNPAECSLPCLKSVPAREQHQQVPFSYLASNIEQYVHNNAIELQLNSSTGQRDSGCRWILGTKENQNEEVSQSPPPTPPGNHSATIQSFIQELEEYARLDAAFSSNVTDLRRQIAHDGNHQVCATLRLHADGLPGLFASDVVSHATTFGSIEPLVPPLRHPGICSDRPRYMMNTDYILHDYEALCRKLKPTSKIIFIDMGAALDFHGKSKSPAVREVERFTRFGFPFDHIYAFEKKPKDTAAVFLEQLPADWLSTYHWINEGVSAEVGHKMNPYHMLESAFSVDDFVVMKLDIDTPTIELPLARQLLAQYYPLVDVFYFEHHVKLLELRAWSNKGVAGSILDSLELFRGLREKGVAAHSWV